MKNRIYWDWRRRIGWRRQWLLTALTVVAFTSAHAETLRIPAATAYLDAAGPARVGTKGVTRWTDPETAVMWFGEFSRTGEISATLELRLPQGRESRLQLAVDGHAREVVAAGTEADQSIKLSFGQYPISSTGYHKLTLRSLNPPGDVAGDIEALQLDGPALEGAHFNLKERRNAASVHLAYPAPAGKEVAGFYCEVTAIEDPPATFYMACGWRRGYFGMQVNSATERRIIFSVWDSGGEKINRAKVADENRVKLLGRGEGVVARDFGNEGTGGHSHLKYMWKTGQPQRFYVTAQPTNDTFTIYSGYYFHPDAQEWMLISSWRAPKDGQWLRGLHSFSENFSGANGHLLRRALYGNQWIRTAKGNWEELTVATFSHDATGKGDRRDRFMGVSDGQFFLSHGGFIGGYTTFGDRFERPATGQPPLREDALPHF